MAASSSFWIARVPIPALSLARACFECALAHAWPRLFGKVRCRTDARHGGTASSGDPRRNTMLIRSAIASAVLAALTTGCTPSPQAPKAVINDKTYAVAPGAITVKSGLLSGALTEMKVVERVEDGSGRIDLPARLTGKLVLTNVSKDQSVRLLGGKLLYIDMQGKR